MGSTKWFWGTLALGGLAIWFWRSAQAREAASQALNTARTTLSNNESLSPVRDAVSKAGEALKPATDQVKDAASKAADALKPAIDQVKDAASKAADAVKPAVDQVKDAAGKAADQASDAADKAADAVKPAVDQVKDAAGKAADQASDAADKAADAVKPAVDQVKDAAGKAADQASDAADKAADAVKPAVDQVKDVASKASATIAPGSGADDLAPHDEDIAGVLDLDGQNLTITQRVLSSIGHEATLKGVPHINVNTEEGGVVFLRGIVFTQEQREFAELVAATTEGVQSVVNELNIEQGQNSNEQAAAPSPQPSELTGSQEPDDEDVAGILDLDGENLTITQRVLSHFGHEPVLANTQHINVNTQERGVVYLRGVVSTEEQRRVAQEVAAQTEGVLSVVNELNVE